MEMARRFLTRDAAQFADQGRHRHAVFARALRDVIEPQVFNPSRARNPLGRFALDEAEARLGARQRRLNFKHQLKMVRIGEQSTHLGRAPQRAENLRVRRMYAHRAYRCQRSKNTVSRSPCSTMSKRKTRPPP